MRIQQIGHSGFLVETDDVSMVFDLFQDPAGVLPAFFAARRGRGDESIPPVVFFVSHAHADHCSPEIFRYVQDPFTFYVLEDQAAERLAAGPFPMGPPGPGQILRVRADEVHRLPIPSEDPEDKGEKILVETFGSTDEGVSFLIRIGTRGIFHSGDLNDWYWAEESTPAELLHDEAAFDGIIARIAERIDAEGTEVQIAFLPVDARLGVHAMRGAIRFLQKIAVEVVFPMHLSGGIDLPGLLGQVVPSSVTRVAALDGPGGIMEMHEP